MQNPVDFIEFVHPALDEEVRAIGGHYVLTKEIRASLRCRDILYFVGYAVIDTSCCGVGGCIYAIVPGFVLEWKYKKAANNQPVSRIEPVKDPAIRQEIRRLIEDREKLHQISFN